MCPRENGKQSTREHRITHTKHFIWNTGGSWSFLVLFVLKTQSQKKNTKQNKILISLYFLLDTRASSSQETLSEFGSSSTISDTFFLVYV